MLSWSESNPDVIAEPGLAGQLALEMSDEEYEAKISGLLVRVSVVGGSSHDAHTDEESVRTAARIAVRRALSNATLVRL